MGPSKDPASTAENQATRSARGWGCEKRVRRPRRRVCLLKGCERRFRPVHPLARYCSQECREEARRWREWKARHRYRQSEGGKQKRRAQSRRYRMRCQRVREARPTPGKPHEGHRKKNYFAPPVIDRAATRNSSGVGVLPCSDFVRTPVGAPWSGFWSANGVGGKGHKSSHGDLGTP